MYINSLLLGTISLILCLSGRAQEIKNKSHLEPKSTFQVTVNGKNYEVSEEEDLKIDTLKLKATISIKLSKRKKFDNSSISFEYPRHLAFDFEEDAGYKSWTFTGNSLVIIIFELDAETPLSALVEEWVKKFGVKNCVVKDFQKQLGPKKWKGSQLTVSLVGQKLDIDCYEIVLNDNKSRFIYVQDTLEENLHSKEYEEGLIILNSSIKFR
jgi:hypothetical protein